VLVLRHCNINKPFIFFTNWLGGAISYFGNTALQAVLKLLRFLRMQAEMAGMFGISLAQRRNASGVRRPLFGSEFLCVAGNRGTQQRRDGCEGNASTAKTHSGLPGHPALLPRAAASSVAIR
jgi:hypothetical protein